MKITVTSVTDRLERVRHQLRALECESESAPSRGFGNYRDFNKWDDWRNWNNPPQPGWSNSGVTRGE